MTGKQKALILGAAGAAAWLAVKAARAPLRYRVRGKTVLITGGSRGLGLVLGRELARRGARLAICARDADELDRAASDLREHGAPVVTVPCDLASREQVARMVHAITGQFGPIDVLINNASTITVGPVETMGLSDFEESLRNNFYSALHTILEVLPAMRQRRAGRIVNIASIGGKVSVPHLLPYDASKFALVGLSEGLRAELLGEGVVVTTVCPGLMRTGSPRHANFKGRHREEYAWFAISDSLPGVSMSAESAARQIVRALQRGDAEVVLSLPAKCAVLFHGVFPGLTADILGLVNRLLPASGGVGQQAIKGKDSESALAPSWLTSLTEEAAVRNNETPDGPRGDGHHNRIRGYGHEGR